MQRDPRAFLWDVRESALAIQTFTAGMDAGAYAANEMAQSAVERKFEIIGEALNQLAKLDAALAARNQLIPGYATVNVGTVWNVTQNALPLLVGSVQALLDELGDA
jgi:uncharacterized protein with HEPN domain